MYDFATVKKDGRFWVQPLGEPRIARDVFETAPGLRASVGGGQISLTSVLVMAFVHVLLCLFAFPALLSVPAPSVPSSNAQQVRSSDARRYAMGVPGKHGGLLSVGSFLTREFPERGAL